MRHILNKLTEEEVKELSKSIQAAQAKKFGNPLSLRKQEELMAEVFQQKNWSTVLGLAQGIPNDFKTLKAMVSKAMSVLKEKQPNLEGKKWKEYAQALKKEREAIIDCLAWSSVLVKEEDDKNKSSCKKCGGENITDYGEKFNPRYFCNDCGAGTDKKDYKFFKTKIEYIVLSEGEYQTPDSLAAISHDCMDGDCVGYFQEVSSEGLTREEARNELYAAGSDESFFNLNELSTKEIQVIEAVINQVYLESEKALHGRIKMSEMRDLTFKVYEQMRDWAITNFNRANNAEDISETDRIIVDTENSIDEEKIEQYLINEGWGND